MLSSRWLRDLLALVHSRKNRRYLAARSRKSIRLMVEPLEDRITPTGPTLSTLASFDGTNGTNPYAGLIMDSSGNLYGTTEAGGASNHGTIFELAKGSNTITTLASFDGTNGQVPVGGLIMDNSGNLYGTAKFGGAFSDGTIFELAKGGNTITTLASFNGTDGEQPEDSLIMDGSGNLYGTTVTGGASNYGTIFELAKGSNTITTLASFNGTNGAVSESSLLMDGSGNLYGTAWGGGPSGFGTIFELAKGSSTITALASFNNTDGAHPGAGVIMDNNGNLYGTAEVGGASGDGTVFELAKGSSTITTLATFNGTNGQNPTDSLLMDGSGNLYGTTELGGAGGAGSIFEVAQGTDTLTTLASFNGNGLEPQSNLIADNSGNFYGTTNEGSATNDGTIFELQGVTSGSPTVTTQPSNQTVTAGQSATFTATASGNPTPTVQWQVSTDGGQTFTNLSGATSTTLTLNNVAAAMNGYEYQAVFTNSVGTATSNAATLTVQDAPSITSQPSNQTVTAGANATFTATANGNPTPTVQWQVSTDGGSTFSNISGATSTTLTLNNVAAAMNGYEYQAVFTNSVGTATSNAATLTVQYAPTVSSQPSNQTVTAGQSVTFTTTASGNPTPTVQWQVSTDGGSTFKNISGATGTTLTFNGVSTSMNGYEYRAVFTNSVNSTTTNAATLNVNGVPILLSPSTIPTGTAGTAYNQTIASSGGSGALTLTYGVISGSVPSGLTITPSANQLTLQGTPTASGSAILAVTAKDNFGDTTTRDYILTVNPAPTPPPPALNVPFLLGFFNGLLGGVETVNANGTETVTDSLFGIPLLVSTFDASGNLESVTLFGFNITFLFTL